MARDERLDREVAVKIVARERVLEGRFEREARAAARLSHPAIVTLYEAAVDDEGAYLVSELVRGPTLHELLAGDQLSDRDAVAIAMSLCDALTHAHTHGVIHRDVKPSNVLVVDHPSSPAHPAKLTDFGVARLIDGDALTRGGDVIGTAAYMAPEQAEGLQVGASADLYAVALVTYEALTGTNPVRTNTAALRARRLGAHLPPLRRQRRDLPRELGRAIDLALRPRPRERGTIEELRAALQAAVTEVEDDPRMLSQAAAPASTPAHDWVRGPLPDPLAPAHGRNIGRPAEAELPEPPEERPGVPSPPWPARALGAAAAALVAAWLAVHLLLPGPLGPAAVAVATAAAVGLFPRLGWLTMTAAMSATAAIQGRPGAALLALTMGVLPLLSMPLRGTLWGVPAGAPALGLIGLAGAWPAIAGRAGGLWRRAALGGVGWLWVALASPLAGTDLYQQRPLRPPLPPGWAGSLSTTIHEVLAPLLNSGALAAAAVWGVAAAILPLLLRGRSLALDIVLAVGWAAATVAATQTVTNAAAASPHAGFSGPVLIGAALGVVVALAPGVVVGYQGRRDAHGPQPQLP